MRPGHVSAGGLREGGGAHRVLSRLPAAASRRGPGGGTLRRRPGERVQRVLQRRAASPRPGRCRCRGDAHPQRIAEPHQVSRGRGVESRSGWGKPLGKLRAQDWSHRHV